MTAPEPPQAMTLEEALVAIAKKRGTTLAYHVGDGSHDDPSGWVEAETGTLYGDYRHWRDAASSILGRHVVERDDTAELVEALERLLANEPMPFIGHKPGAFVILVTEADIATARAALARVKGGER